MVQVYSYDKLTSTMDEARSLILGGNREEFVVVAATQTAGRGRRGRAWVSSIGNLFITYCTQSKCLLSLAPQLSFVACVAVGEALQPILPIGNIITYKWPNDVLLNGKKLAGILLETVETSRLDEFSCLIGCGLNITEFPSDVRYKTTSLYNEGILLTYDEVLSRIIDSFTFHIYLWETQGFSPIYDLWMKSAAYLHDEIRLDLQGQILEGVFKGMDTSGAMLLKTTNGVKKINAGEVLGGGAVCT